MHTADRENKSISNLLRHPNNITPTTKRRNK